MLMVSLVVLAPLLVLLLVMVAVAAIVQKRRYHPTQSDWTDWSARAARQRDDGGFNPHGGGGR